MDEDIVFLIFVHFILLVLLVFLFWQTKRRKRRAVVYQLLIGLDITIIVFTGLGFLNVFGQLVATDGFEIGMYSFFGSAFLTAISLIIFLIQFFTKPKATKM